MLITKRRELPQAFTLIELLAVMITVTILAGLFMAAGSAARRKALEIKAKNMISNLQVAISLYHADTGDYPPGGYLGWTCTELYKKLTDTVHGDPLHIAYIPGWKGPYMEFSSDELMQRAMPVGTTTTIRDPWGREYRYDVSSPPNNPESYDLWSVGADGTDGTADDITNW